MALAQAEIESSDEKDKDLQWAIFRFVLFCIIVYSRYIKFVTSVSLSIFSEIFTIFLHWENFIVFKIIEKVFQSFSFQYIITLRSRNTFFLLSA